MTKGESFFENIALEANNGEQETETYKEMQKNDKMAEEVFMEYHNQKYCSKDKKSGTQEITEDKSPEELLKIGRTALVKNYFLYVKNKIRNFEYIKDGKVDIEKYLKDTVKVFFKAQLLRIDAKTIGPIYEESISELIENSHLLYEKEGEERKKLQKQITNDIITTINEMVVAYNNGKSINEVAKFEQEKEPYIQCNTNQALKMADTFLKKENFKEDTPFIEIMSKVSRIAKATNMTERDLSYVLSKLAIELSDNPQKYLGVAEKYLTTIHELENLKQQYDENLDTVSYKRVDMNCFLDEKTYIEKKDDTYSILSLDEETGKVYRLPLTRFGQIEKKRGIYVDKINEYSILGGNVPKDMQEALKQGQNVYSILNPKGNLRSYISFSNNLDKMQVSGGKIYSSILKFEQVEQDLLNRIALSSIREGIKKGEYSDFSKAEENLPDSLRTNIATTERIDYGPRFIKTDKLLRAYKDIQTLIPGIEASTMEFRELSEMLIDKTFRIDTIPNRDKKEDYEYLLETYPECKRKIVDNIIYIAKSNADVEDDRREKRMRIIEAAVEDINVMVSDAQPIESRAAYFIINDKQPITMQSLVKNALSNQNIRKEDIEKADQNEQYIKKEQEHTKQENTRGGT